jgi:hypothetical protein
MAPDYLFAGQAAQAATSFRKQRQRAAASLERRGAVLSVCGRHELFLSRFQKQNDWIKTMCVLSAVGVQIPPSVLDGPALRTLFVLRQLPGASGVRWATLKVGQVIANEALIKLAATSPASLPPRSLFTAATALLPTFWRPHAAVADQFFRI